MMKRLALAAIALVALVGSASAQMALIAPNVPSGDSSDRIANTKFVTSAISGVTSGSFISPTAPLTATYSGGVWTLGLTSGTGLTVAGSSLNLKPASASEIGGVESFTAPAHQWINAISTAGVPSSSQPSVADLSDGTTGTGTVVLSASPTLTGTLTAAAESLNSLTVGGSSVSAVPALVLANSTNQFASFDKPTVRTWTWEYATTQLAANATTTDQLFLTDDDATNDILHVTDVGQIFLGNIYASYALPCNTGVSSSLCAGTGKPLLNVLGDEIVGDLIYFGASSTAGTEVQQIGVRAWGAYASATILSSSWQDYDYDSTATNCTHTSTNCGGAFETIDPDDNNQATALFAAGYTSGVGFSGPYGDGTISFHAHGSLGTNNANQIQFWVRTGTNVDTLEWYIGSDGSLNGNVAAWGGTPNTYACFTSGGKLISSASAC